VDLREIQALHAQYASQPVTIDLAGQLAALPAPSGAAGQVEPVRQSGRTATLLRASAKPVAIGLAAGAVAIGCALSGLQLYRAMHKIPTPAAVTAAAPISVPAHQDMPVNSEPAHPLTARDLDGHTDMPGSGLSSVDLHSLERTPARTVEAAVATGQDATAQQSAAASPIHASHSSPAPTALPSASVAPAAAQPASTSPLPPMQTVDSKAGGPAGLVAPSAASEPMPATKPAAKPAHRTAHRRSQAASEQPAAAGTEVPTRPAAPAGKSVDVQLF
jgi:hypothetical protein